jgi:hypothetical protein
MTPAGIKEAHDLNIEVCACIADIEFFGIIKEIGSFSFRAGPGSVIRALVKIETNNGQEIFAHIKDIRVK